MVMALKVPGYSQLLQFCSPLCSHEHNCPISNKDRLLALLSCPLKTAISFGVIKEMLASIFHADTMSSVYLDMAKVRLSPPSHCYPLFVVTSGCVKCRCLRVFSQVFWSWSRATKAWHSAKLCSSRVSSLSKGSLASYFNKTVNISFSILCNLYVFMTHQTGFKPQINLPKIH